MDLVALHIFKTVAEAGGITRAAARLHRVQSNVTTRVKQLEERLGTRLFHRHKRRLVLSAEGRCCSNTPSGCCGSRRRPRPRCATARRAACCASARSRAPRPPGCRRCSRAITSPIRRCGSSS